MVGTISGGKNCNVEFCNAAQPPFETPKDRALEAVRTASGIGRGRSAVSPLRGRRGVRYQNSFDVRRSHGCGGPADPRPRPGKRLGQLRRALCWPPALGAAAASVSARSSCRAWLSSSRARWRAGPSRLRPSHTLDGRRWGWSLASAVELWPPAARGGQAARAWSRGDCAIRSRWSA